MAVRQIADGIIWKRSTAIASHNGSQVGEHGGIMHGPTFGPNKQGWPYMKRDDQPGSDTLGSESRAIRNS